MTERQFIFAVLVALLVAALIGAGIATATYLTDRERESEERMEANRPHKLWERKP